MHLMEEDNEVTLPIVDYHFSLALSPCDVRWKNMFMCIHFTVKNEDNTFLCRFISSIRNREAVHYGETLTRTPKQGYGNAQ